MLGFSPLSLFISKFEYVYAGGLHAAKHEAGNERDRQKARNYNRAFLCLYILEILRAYGQLIKDVAMTIFKLRLAIGGCWHDTG